MGKKDDKAPSVRELAEAAKFMPQYQMAVKKLSKHIKLVSECNSMFRFFGSADAKSKSSHLQPVAEFEQTLASGVDDDNNTVKEKALKEVSAWR
jgi:hypothetical protein